MTCLGRLRSGWGGEGRKSFLRGGRQTVGGMEADQGCKGKKRFANLSVLLRMIGDGTRGQKRASTAIYANGRGGQGEVEELRMTCLPLTTCVACTYHSFETNTHAIHPCIPRTAKGCLGYCCHCDGPPALGLGAWYVPVKRYCLPTLHPDGTTSSFLHASLTRTSLPLLPPRRRQRETVLGEKDICPRSSSNTLASAPSQKMGRTASPLRPQLPPPRPPPLPPPPAHLSRRESTYLACTTPTNALLSSTPVRYVPPSLSPSISAFLRTPNPPSLPSSPPSGV